MKRLISIIIGTIYQFIYFLKRKHIYINIKSLFWCKIQVSRKNKIVLKGPRNHYIKIEIEGQNNAILSNASLSHTEIRIYGNNNILNLEEGVRILSGTIVIKGNGCQINVKKNTTTGFNLYMVCMGQSNYINIGKNCMIADNVDIWASDSHPIIDTTNNIINPSRPIEIEDHVWLGKSVKVLKGIKIGANAVIGMGGTVTSDIKPSTLNVGTPTKMIKDNINWDRSHIHI